MKALWPWLIIFAAALAGGIALMLKRQRDAREREEFERYFKRLNDA